MLRTLLFATTMLVAHGSIAATPDDLLRSYVQQASAQSPAYSGPSAASGRRFFSTTRKDWSCATCHTADPVQPGKHAVTGKPIAPLAPSANLQRFRDQARADKWFRRNCNDTLGRECTPAEKADVLAWLLEVGKGA